MKKRITPQKVLENQIEQMISEQIKEEKFKAKTPQLGPRTRYIYYIYDLKMKHIDAMKRILTEFPEINYKMVEKWYDEEAKRREELENSDEGR